MVTTTAVILCKTGLHARLAAELVKVTQEFESDIEIENDQMCINGRVNSAWDQIYQQYKDMKPLVRSLNWGKEGPMTLLDNPLKLGI